MRRNHVTIKLTAKREIDDALLEEYGMTEAQSIEIQRNALEEMLEEYSAYDDFHVELSVTIDEEEEF